MASLTIFGRKSERKAIVEGLRNATNLPIKISGNDDSWESLLVTAPRATLTFNALLRNEPGDQFSKTVLGGANFFRRVNTDAKNNQSFVKDAILNTKLIIGVVAEPELAEDAGFPDLLFEAAHRCDGLIFNGEGMVDTSGDLLLDKQGRYDRVVD